MNFISLFFINLQKIIKKHKFVYIIFYIFMIASVFFILFSQNVYMNLIKTTSTSDFCFTIKINNYDTVFDDINSLCSEFKEIKNVDGMFLKNQQVFYAELYIKSGYAKANPGKDLTMEMIKNSEKYILYCNLSPDFNKSDAIKIGSTIMIENDEFEIIGYSGYGNILPYTALTNKNIVTDLTITMDINTSQKTINKIKSTISDINSITVKSEPDFKEQKVSKLLSALLIIILSIGIFNMQYIYTYMLSIRTDTISLFRLYGFSKKKALYYLFFEFFVFVVTAILLGIVLYLIISGFNYTAFFYRNNLNVSNILFTATLFIIYYIICFLPIIKKYIKNTPFENIL